MKQPPTTQATIDENPFEKAAIMSPAFNILIHFEFLDSLEEILNSIFDIHYVTLTTGAFKMSSYNIPSYSLPTSHPI